jgi:hypothetical protein
MRRQRTTPILVIAILHLVGGGLGLILSLCGCGGLVMSNALSSAIPTVPQRPGQPPPPPNANEITKYMDDHVPGYRAFQFGSVALSLLLDVMLISAGIGLLSVQPWARWLSLAYAPLSILIRLVGFVYQLVWVTPAMESLYAQNPAMKGMSGILSASVGIGAFVGLLFAITVLVIMLLPSTAAAFRGELPTREDDYEERELEEEDDPWREPPPPRSDKFRR